MNLFSISGLSLGLTCMLLALIIARYGKTKLHRIWFFFNSSVAIWGFGCFIVGQASTESTALFGWRFAHVGGIFVAIFFYHMSCIFCDLKRRKSVLAVYLIGLFFVGFNVMTVQFIGRTRYIFDIYYNDATRLYSIILGFWLALVILSFSELLRFLPKTKGVKRIQTLYIIVGFLIGFLGGMSTFLPEFRIDFFYPFGNFTIPIYCIISTYAILRHRLMDISLVIRKGMVYSASAGILASLFVVIILTMTRYFSDITGITSFTMTIFAALTIAVLFNPLKNRIQLFYDKTFYKRTYDYFATIQKVSQELTSMFDIKKIFSFVGDILFSTLGLSNVYLLSADYGANYRMVHHMSYKGEKKDGKTHNEKGMFEREGDTKHVPRFDINPDFINILKHSDDVVIKDELPGVVEIFGKEIIESIEKTMESFNGEVIVPVFVDKKLSALMFLGEKLSGDMFTKEDINLLVTVSNQTAVALKNAKLYAEKLGADRFASMGLMSATFAHEIRNPLTSIKTFAQLIPEKYKDEEFREVFSKVVIDDIERINRLIKDLLSFSDEKSLTFKENFDVISLIDGILNHLKTKLNLEDRKIYVEKIYKSVKIILSGDSKKLKQAFINIITNACQAIGESGTLKITITPNGKYVDIMINDTGSGISREDIEKIFDPFYTTSPMGMGLGLAISKKIIEDHGGMITVNSEIEQGSTFTVSLPAQN